MRKIRNNPREIGGDVKKSKEIVLHEEKWRERHFFRRGREGGGVHSQTP